MRANHALMSTASSAARFDRILANLRRLERRVEGPRDLLELERAALANAALIRVRESAGVDEHRRETGRIEHANAVVVCAPYDRPCVPMRPLHHGCFTIQAQQS